MCAAKKIKERNPSLIGVFISAILMALIGGLLGFLFLGTFPIEAFSSLQERDEYLEGKTGSEPKPGEAYYLEGPEQRSRTWELKREQLVNGSDLTVNLSVGELNAWMASVFKPGSTPDEEEQPKILLIPEVPNFFVEAPYVFHINLPVKVIAFGQEREYKVIAKGHLAGAPQKNFILDSLSVNGAKVPLYAGIGDQIVNKLLQAFSGSDEYATMRTAWDKVGSVELAGDVIRLQVR